MKNMNRTKPFVYLILLAAVMVSSFCSCTKKLDLDEDTVILIEKQDKLASLEKLFDLSFEDPEKAKADYNQFVSEELFTADRNFLTDEDIRISNNYTSAVINLNAGFNSIEQEISKKTLFELYDTKFTSSINNQDLFGDIPLQLKTGDRYNRFKEKVAYINTYFDKKIEEQIANTVVDKSITGKKWLLSKFYYDWGSGQFYNINFDITLNDDKSTNVNSFFFIPFTRYIGINETSITDLKPNLLSAVRYAVYNNKICFYFHLKDNVDQVRNTGHIARNWVFEFSYHVDGNNLIFSEPRKRLYLAPIYYKDNFNDENFKDFYAEDLQKFVLETTP